MMTEGNDLMVWDRQLSLLGCSSCGGRGILSPHWERCMFVLTGGACSCYTPECPECDGDGGR